MHRPSLSALLAAALVVAAPAMAASPRPLPLALKDIADRAAHMAPGRRIRLAVMPLKGTASQRYGDRGFGAYLTEQLSTALGGLAPAVRLFERERLDVVLKEQAFASSGLMDESEARRIGELAPIDYILTGTFTRLEGSVALQVRFLDVVSGEVAGSLSESVELSPDLAGLFEDLRQVRPPESAKGVQPATDPCEARWAPVRRAMEDIGTPAKLECLVKEATAIPFEGPCGKIHEQVTWLLVRYKRESPAYRRFLVGVLPTIAEPDDDERTGAVLVYLEGGGELDDAEWAAVQGLMARSRRPWSYLDLLLRDAEHTAAPRKRLVDRAGRLLAEAKEGRIGRPVPIDSGRLLTQVLSRLRSREGGKTDLGAAFTAYERYGSRYGVEGDPELMKLLFRFWSESEGRERRQAFDWLCGRIAEAPPSRDLAELVVQFHEGLLKGVAPGHSREVREVPRSPELDRLATLCGRKIVAVLPQVINRESRIELMRFCLAHGLQGGEVPSRDALLAQLDRPEPLYERQEALRMLAALGPGAEVAEGRVLKLLRRAEILSGWGGQARYFQKDLLDFAGVIRTRNPELIGILVQHLGSLESLYYEAAIGALARIGAPAIPQLKSAYDQMEQHPKQLIARTLGTMGAPARGQLPWLRAQIPAAPNRYVRNALEDAIEALEKGRAPQPIM
nr:CsgG/HfaB family protein [uncultured Holophaga sp.]